MAKLSEFIPKAFASTWRAALNSNILNIVEKGGRGSGKSSDIAHIITQLLMRYAVNAVGIRYVDNTLEQSIYEQMKWAIEEQGVTHLFKFNKSPLRITYIPRGELDDGLFYKFFYSYNPPKRKQSWVNKKYESSFQPANTFVHHSTYHDNPFISKEFIEEAEATRARSERRYDWEYLGKAIGSGVVPFDNLQVVPGSITDDMVANFDNIRNAVDFGYATDPLAHVRWQYDKKKNGIYAIDELYGQKISNREYGKWLHKMNYSSDTIFADSAEPKSIAELKTEHNVPHIKGVKKGPDSVEYGEQWLDDLDFICIDPQRTPKIAWEFENIDYQVDKDGNPKPRLEDNDNHTIDATRYAFSEDMRNVKTTIASKASFGLY